MEAILWVGGVGVVVGLIVRFIVLYVGKANAKYAELVGAQPQHSHMSYRAKRGTLLYQETVGGAFAVPAPEEFKAQLELLARLADVNRQVNI